MEFSLKKIFYGYNKLHIQKNNIFQVISNNNKPFI